MAGMVVFTSPSFSSNCPAGHLGLAGCSFPLYCASPRTLPCLCSQSFGSLCLPLAMLFFYLMLALLLSCLLLALLLSCLLLALLLCLLLALLFCLLLALLFSVPFIVVPDLRCFSRCPRTRVALLRSSLLFTTGSFAVVLSRILTTCSLAVVRRCFSLSKASLAVVPSVLLLQSHIVVGYDSVARF